MWVWLDVIKRKKKETSHMLFQILNLVIKFVLMWLNHVGSLGVISVQVHNPAVTNSILNEIWQWKADGCLGVDFITHCKKSGWNSHQLCIPPMLSSYTSGNLVGKSHQHTSGKYNVNQQ